VVAVEGHRWAIEDSFETAKNEFGLDHNESRSWHGWHRHVSLVMLAFAMMAAIRYRANPPPPKKTKRPTTATTRHNRTAVDPLVDPGSPPHRHLARSKADSTRPCHRVVILAQGSPSRSTARSSQKKATVMLGKQHQRFAPLRIAKDAESLEALPRFLQVVVMRRQHMSGLPKRNLKLGIVQIG
jgi:hypothetical protein